jgi:MSHA biogenesis protein MshK
MAGGLENMNVPIKLAMGCVALMVSMSVCAQALGDPTRPPAGFGATPANGVAPAPPAKASLQTIIRRANAQPAAVIDGQFVALGGRIGDARLVRVGEDSVDLLTTTGRETLQLTPGIGKQPVATGNGVAKRPRQGKHREGRGTEEAKP